jgi:hypothetical protein
MTMNWAVMMRASAAQRRSDGLAIVATDIYRSPNSLALPTIARNNGWTRYTS